MKRLRTLRALALALVLALILPLSAAAAATGQEVTPPQYDPLPYTICIFDTENLLYHFMADSWVEPYASAIDKVLDTLVPATKSTGPLEGGVVTISNDNKFTKRQYLLRGGTMEIDGKAYAMDLADYKAMKEACANAVLHLPGI